MNETEKGKKGEFQGYYSFLDIYTRKWYHYRLETTNNG